MELIPEEIRVTCEQLPNDLVVSLFALRVPHLFIAAQPEHLYCFVNLAISLQHPQVICKRGRVGVVGMLGTHHFGH